MAEPTSGPSGALLVAALLLAAVGAAALVFAPALALAGDLAREGASETKLSVLTMAFGLGTALGPLASGFLIRYGYSIPFGKRPTLSAKFNAVDNVNAIDSHEWRV